MGLAHSLPWSSCCGPLSRNTNSVIALELYPSSTRAQPNYTETLLKVAFRKPPAIHHVRTRILQIIPQRPRRPPAQALQRSHRRRTPISRTRRRKSSPPILYTSHIDTRKYQKLTTPPVHPPPPPTPTPPATTKPQAHHQRRCLHTILLFNLGDA